MDEIRGEWVLVLPTPESRIWVVGDERGDWLSVVPQPIAYIWVEET